MFYRRDRPNDPHGGVMIAVKSDMEVIDIETHKDLELMCVTLKVGKKKMVIVAFYRPPNMTDQPYLDSVKQDLRLNIRKTSS